jgi:hypothetical protein
MDLNDFPPQNTIQSGGGQRGTHTHTHTHRERGGGGEAERQTAQTAGRAPAYRLAARQRVGGHMQQDLAHVPQQHGLLAAPANQAGAQACDAVVRQELSPHLHARTRTRITHTGRHEHAHSWWHEATSAASQPASHARRPHARTRADICAWPPGPPARLASVSSPFSRTATTLRPRPAQFCHPAPARRFGQGLSTFLAALTRGGGAARSARRQSRRRSRAAPQPRARAHERCR